MEHTKFEMDRFQFDALILTSHTGKQAMVMQTFLEYFVGKYSIEN